jgi:hypothetical protein
MPQVACMLLAAADDPDTFGLMLLSFFFHHCLAFYGYQ